MSLAACGSAPHYAGHWARGHARYTIGRSYKVKGVWYSPHADWSYNRTGIASWYGEAFQGHTTSDGEIYNLNALTAAHKTLQLPCVVRVTNLENGRSLEVRVNDRGPFAPGRIIDVSRRAAQLLGFERQGTAPVRVQLLPRPSLRVAEAAGMSARQGIAVASSAPPSRPARPVRVAENRPLPIPASASNGARNEQIAAAPVASLASTRIYIQAGAFADEANAMRLRDRLRGLGSPVEITGAAVGGLSVYRVRLGPALSVDAADALLERVYSVGVSKARIVVD
ncbi:MAG: septal ring lytic transglycosylase RlpA family protein [Stellaceae bacterium]